MESNSSSNNELNPFASPELSEHLSNTSVAHNEEALVERKLYVSTEGRLKVLGSLLIFCGLVSALSLITYAFNVSGKAHWDRVAITFSLFIATAFGGFLLFCRISEFGCYGCYRSIQSGIRWAFLFRFWYLLFKPVMFPCFFFMISSHFHGFSI